MLLQICSVLHWVSNRNRSQKLRHENRSLFSARDRRIISTLYWSYYKEISCKIFRPLVHLKGWSNEIFDLQFFPKANPPVAPWPIDKILRFLLRIHWDIRILSLTILFPRRSDPRTLWVWYPSKSISLGSHTPASQSHWGCNVYNVYPGESISLGSDTSESQSL